MGKLVKNYRILLILTLAFGLRVYRSVDHFGLAHDQDLAAWIVKDIVVNHHFRLIGQLTSTDGIFIGPLYYYLQIPFFWILGMDIKAILLLPILLGIITTFSYYFVFRKIFGLGVGLIASSIHAVNLALVLIDRWSVPTVTMPLWSVWFFYFVVKIFEGDFRYLWILGVLVGLIWHVQLSLLPLVLLIPLGIWISRRKIRTLNPVGFFLGLGISSIPLVLFEVRHNFSQTRAFWQALFGTDGNSETGILKLGVVMNLIMANVNRIFFYVLPVPVWLGFVVTVCLGLFIYRKKLLPERIWMLSLSWFTVLILAFTFNGKEASHYYFHSLNVVYVLIFALFLNSLKRVGILILFIGVITNIWMLISMPYNATGYNEKTAITKYILADSRERGFGCLGLSFITDHGEGVGYRYLFWKYGIKTKNISSNLPIYTVVMPWTYSADSVVARFGLVGVISPGKKADGMTPEECRGDNSNLTDPMLQYVN